MKLSIFIFTLITFCLVLVIPAMAQTWLNPNTVPPYNLYRVAAAKTYTHAQADTLPQPAAATGITPGLKVCACSKLALVITATDSMLADVYYDYKMRGVSNTWTLAHTDSVKITSNSGGIREIICHADSINHIMALDCTVRWRIVQRAVSGYSATYNADVLWKP